MSRIIVATSEMAGRINVACELARRLEDRGHHVHVAGRHPAVASAVGERGIPYLDFAATAAPESATRPSTSGRFQRLVALVRRLRSADRSARTQRKAGSLGISEFLSSVGDISPDLVLIDLELTEVLMASHASDHPTAGWTTMLSVWKGRGLPPLGSGIVPGSGLSGSRLAIEAAWLRFRLQRWFFLLRQRLTRVGEDRISVLRAAAAGLDYRFDHHFDLYQWLKPALPRRLPIISFNLGELDFPHRGPANAIYAGPLIGPRPTDVTVSRDVAKLMERSRSQPDRALIYCSFGAWDKGDDRDLIKRVIRACASRPEWELIVGLGGRLDPAALGEVPGNVHVLAWAPQTEILPLADAAIHHAGISSVNECIREAVPMLVYPFDFLDQPGNAARVAHHRLGIRGDRRADSAAAIAQHLERLLEGEFTGELTSMQALLRARDEQQTAAVTVESLLDGSS